MAAAIMNRGKTSRSNRRLALILALFALFYIGAVIGFIIFY